MKYLLTIMFTTVLSSYAIADHHERRTDAIELFECSYSEGSDISDLKKVAAEWDEWTDGKFTHAYDAYLMQPIKYAGADFSFDYIWLGVTHTQEAMGRNTDEWIATGGRLQEKFDSVAPCSGSSLAVSTEIKPYANIGETGFLQISSCELHEGVRYEDLESSDLSWVDWLAKNDIAAGLYRWKPSVGNRRNNTPDFYNVYVVESLADRGATADKMLAGGSKIAQSLYGQLYSCDSPRVWMSEPVGSIVPR